MYKTPAKLGLIVILAGPPLIFGILAFIISHLLIVWSKRICLLIL